MRRWLELSAEVPRAAGDALSAWMVEQGAPGVIEEDAADRVRLRAHFEPERKGELAGSVRGFLRELEEFFPGSAGARIDVRLVDEEDWGEGWKQSFPPLEVGRRLRIRTPWSAPRVSERREIEIVPAMAFGTGQHASTLGCLLALEDLFEGERRPSPVLDVGTGSGVLAIAAAKLGAERVVALDVDPVAVEAAAENVRRNGVERVVTVRAGALEAANERYRLIVANLHTALLRELFPRFAERAEPEASLVVSGLLDADEEDVSSAAVAGGWSLVGRRSIDGWATLMLRRSD